MCVQLVEVTFSSVFPFIAQIEDQLKRLITQLQDLEEMKEDLDENEYTSERQVLFFDVWFGRTSLTVA